MSLIAVAAISIPFFGSLKPNDRSLEISGQTGRTVDLDMLASGSFLEKGSEYARYFVLRDLNGQVRLFSVPYRQDTYWIADLHWDRPFLPCDDFGPDSDGNRLIAEGAFRCHDESMGDWYRRESVWDYTGKNLGTRTGDMPEARYEVRGNTLFILDGVWPLENTSGPES